ncbi:MAG TPA: mobile mystery protein B [Terrimicrobiaceae bacterium]|nr:mobile mystery protein B [Terrimicrobiaceae bacterium]
MKGEYPPGSTPLTPEEENGLIPSHVTTRGELNELEQANIVEAETWLLTGRGQKTVADPVFLKQLHRRMFRHVWKWAGAYRKTDRNIGVHWPQISYQTESLCRDVGHWQSDQVYPADEIAIRFHHKLVWIHCFPNGNGRHSRLAADLLAAELGGRPFSWGRASLDVAGETRGRYIAALHRADAHDIGPLLAFARS